MEKAEPLVVPMKATLATGASPKTKESVAPADISNSTTLRELHGETGLQDSTDTGTNSSDEFWEDAAKEDNLKHTEVRRATRGRRVYLSFMKLYRPFRIVLVAVLVSGLLIAPFLIVKFRFPNSVARPHVTAWSIWFTITWAIAALVSIVVDLIPRFVIFLIVSMYGKPRESLTTELELFMAVSTWLKLTLDFSALWITLAVMREILHPPGVYWTYVNRTVSALFAASVILLAEKCFLRFVAIRFHRKALADRLMENKLALRALDKLSNANVQPGYTKKLLQGFKKGHGHKSPSLPASRSTSYDALNKIALTTGDGLPRSSTPGHPHSGNVIEMGEMPHDRSGNITKSRERKQRRKAMTSVILEQLGDAIGAVALKDSKFNRAGEMGGLHSARKLSRKLFASLSEDRPQKTHLVVSDFYPYFPTREDAEVAFQLIDKDGNGDITRREMREAVQRIYRERKALTASLKDVSSAVAKLDGVLLFVALLAIAFASLLIFNRSNALESLVPLATIVLGFSFIFGHSAQTLFESLIFIFSTHVFDVGDLIMVDDQVLLVREFGLFSTTFRRVDGQEIIAPNSILASNKLIHNLRRSSSMWESTVLNIAYETPLDVVEQLKARLKSYVTENNREWLDCAVNIDKVEYQTAMFLSIGMQHKSNWQNWGGRWERRTAFMRHLKTVLEELEIGYTKPMMPVVLHPSSALSAALRLQSRGNIDVVGAGSSPDLGNAGGFAGSQLLAAAPGRSIRADRDHF